jgi:hypothetical protein
MIQPSELPARIIAFLTSSAEAWVLPVAMAASSTLYTGLERQPAANRTLQLHMTLLFYA